MREDNCMARRGSNSAKSGLLLLSNTPEERRQLSKQIRYQPHSNECDQSLKREASFHLRANGINR